MDYVLMHKNIHVIELTLDAVTGSILKLGKLENAEHLPLGISINKGDVNRAALNGWWNGRAIPTSRQGLRNALEEMDVAGPQILLEKCYGLSLSDQYWIRPVCTNLNWNQVNFFENSFSDDVGNYLMGKGSSSNRNEISFLSPDNTSDGWLKKKWLIIDGKRCLVKGGSGATQQEPYNEVLASAIMRRLGIPHVSYKLMIENEYPFSVCEDFITPQTELISAWYVMQVLKKPNHVSVYNHYLNCCDALGVSDIRNSIDQMIVLDYLMLNEDRHQNNFGIIRNADTLEYIGAAPIYDSGSSMCFEYPTGLLLHLLDRNLNCKPFKTTQEEQIKLVKSFDWLDLTALQGIEDEFKTIVYNSPFVDERRCENLCSILKNRIEKLNSVSQRSFTSIEFPDLDHEVEMDVKYSGNDDPEL